ncbi:regulatory subunit of cAMP-dependent protein kinase [Mitosporidium daphniae]|uniref:cGMP-dependent protein kinase n=1 Tax=Mitosporidium daphniae TaxID=1485682 RepID=A0A098VND1_9MICR|nr:regulatory subunit of cAMP-dependent protein kinase [Mitosporidium daphniae]KGG50450.1 regulatory subunit of cAMP-dependent protein kinase [Mitosporidium daphniae]|eukprot:XP_013236877.1 regulatory subunit of cAMP-dependent protein kinase [Mitosporidium daphniae]
MRLALHPDLRNTSRLLALSACIYALSKEKHDLPEKESLIAELESQNALFSNLTIAGHASAVQRNFGASFTPEYVCPPPTEKISSLISLRRGSVSAECVPYPDGVNANYALEEEPPKQHYPKSESSCKLIKEAISSNILFKELDKNQLTDIISCMFERPTKADDVIIRQGDSGDFFYVIEDGVFDIVVNGEKYETISTGASFGELALLYNSPRAATVICSSESGSLWAIDRLTFRKIVINHNYNRRKRYESFLKNIPLFSTLSQLELSKLSDCIKEISYEKDQVVIREGDIGDSFYIVSQGNANVCINGKQEKSLVIGDYFGEMSLITKQPRAATVIAQSNPLSVLRIEVDAFNRLLGPLLVLMKRNMMLYNKYNMVGLQ